MRRASVSLALLIVTACSVSPTVRDPGAGIESPAEWTAPHETLGEPQTNWWRNFGDSRLDRLVEIALEENYDLRAAAARVDAAAASVRIAGADLKPSVSAVVDASRQRQNFIGLPIPGSDGGVASTTYGRRSAQLSASWEIDLWGRIRAGKGAAVAELQAVEADLEGARQSIAAQTAKAWFAVAEAQEQVALARRSAVSFRDLAEQIRSRYQAGLRPALDLRLALSNLSIALALEQRRLLELDAATRRLEVLLGRYPASVIGRDEIGETLPELPGPVPVGLPADIVARRPDLVASERRLAAADYRLIQAKRSLYPRLALTGSAGAASEELGDLLNGDFGVWNLVANLTQPLFEGGRLRGGVERADAVGREVLQLYASAVLQAYSEVEGSLAAEQFLRGRETELREASKQLDAAWRLAEERYRAGLGDYLSVLESQTRAVVAESDLLLVRRNLLDNRVELHLALGGAFDEDEDES